MKIVLRNVKNVRCCLVFYDIGVAGVEKTRAGCETVEGVEGGKLPSDHVADEISLVNLGSREGIAYGMTVGRFWPRLSAYMLPENCKKLGIFCLRYK